MQSLDLSVTPLGFTYQIENSHTFNYLILPQ